LSTSIRAFWAPDASKRQGTVAASGTTPSRHIQRTSTSIASAISSAV
jgi:hypothetical protein